MCLILQLNPAPTLSNCFFSHQADRSTSSSFVSSKNDFCRLRQSENAAVRVHFLRTEFMAARKTKQRPKQQ